MSIRRAIACALPFGALLLASPVRGADDAAQRGKDVYASECADCHSVRPDKNKKGPSLFGIVGRRSANIAGFRYSTAMQQSGITWTAEQLRRYIAAPKQAVPGGRMKYDGLGDSHDLDDLLSYLQTLH